MEVFDSHLELADWINDIEPSAMQISIDFADDPNFISFALGLPDCSLLPIRCIQNATNVLLSEPNLNFQYSQPLVELKQQIVKLMKYRGVVCHENNIFLTSGAQQGIYLLTRLLLNHKGSVLVENYAYPGFIQAIEPYKPNIINVNTDFVSGVDAAQVEKACVRLPRPSLMYFVADGGNPHAATISLENRKKLAILAKTYHIPIIEDDPYGFLHYEDTMLPPIKSFCNDWIFYIGSFSKLLAPSFRVGWIVIPEYLQQPLSILKEGTDINIAPYSQRLVSKILDDLSIEEHIKNIRQQYKKKRELMFNLLKKSFPKETIINLPESGLFFWVRLPKFIDIDKLFELAISQYKVAFIPGHRFAINQTFGDGHYIRLNFTAVSCEKIKEGIQRLADALQQLMSNIR